MDEGGGGVEGRLQDVFGEFYLAGLAGQLGWGLLGLVGQDAVGHVGGGGAVREVGGGF